MAEKHLVARRLPGNAGNTDTIPPPARFIINLPFFLFLFLFLFIFQMLNDGLVTFQLACESRETGACSFLEKPTKSNKWK